MGAGVYFNSQLIQKSPISSTLLPRCMRWKQVKLTNGAPGELYEPITGGVD